MSRTPCVQLAADAPPSRAPDIAADGLVPLDILSVCTVTLPTEVARPEFFVRVSNPLGWV